MVLLFDTGAPQSALEVKKLAALLLPELVDLHKRDRVSRRLAPLIIRYPRHADPQLLPRLPTWICGQAVFIQSTAPMDNHAGLGSADLSGLIACKGC